MKCLLTWSRAPDSSAATGLGSEGRRGGLEGNGKDRPATSFQRNTLGKFNSRSQLDACLQLLPCSGLHKQLCDLNVTILVGHHESSVVLFVLLIYPYLVFE